MTKSRRAPSLPRRIALTAAGAGIGFAALASVGGVAGLVAVARRVVTPPKRKVEDVRVLAIDARTITLSSTKDTRLPGRYGFWFDRGTSYAKLGAIIDSTPQTVTREIVSIDYGSPAAGDRGLISGWYFTDPSDLSYPYESVDIETPLGKAPAWIIPADDSAADDSTAAAPGASRWAIVVHGRGVRRSEGLRAVEVLHDAGYSVMLVSYRNDGDAPASADGRYALGDTEWLDVDAAITHLVDRGATDIVLMGWSMGGATVLQTATRSANAHLIRGLILESPVVDWVTALLYQGRAFGLANPFRYGVLAILSRPWGIRFTGQAVPIDLARLDFVQRASELDVPILLLHSVDDGFVPATASQALALARPDIVEYEEFTVARHTKLWNYDTARWTSTIAGWLRRLPDLQR